MRGLRERWVPVIVVLAVVGVGAVVLVLVQAAQRSGLDALESALTGEVAAIARSQNERVDSSLTNSGQLLSTSWELRAGSENDREALASLLQLVPNVRSGFFLVDREGTITEGVRLSDRAVIGEPYRRAGFEAAQSARSYSKGVGVLLAVDDGLTTALPTIAYLFPIIDADSGELNGSFVFESEVTADAAFNEEISQLRRGRTGEYLFYDDRGTVVAASDPELIARPLDERYATAPLGVSHIDDHVVAIASVPAAGWRIAFRQERDEFEQDLVGPLQSAGRVLVVLLVAVAVVMVVFLVRRLRAARDEQQRLAELAEAQEEFISIVSHELRTPVAGVVGFLESALDHWDAMTEPDRRKAVRRAASNASRLQALTRDVLDTRRLETGELSYTFGIIDLSEVVLTALETAREVYDARTFVLEPLPGEVLVRADEDRLQQVLLNLFDNAVKNSPMDQPLEVRLAVSGDEAVVSVHDHGHGIDPAAMSRIFDKFTRGRGSSVAGTGLGLYISRRIVDSHGGRIWADSSQGEGATLHVALPIEAPVPASSPG